VFAFAFETGKIRGNTTGDVAVDQYHRFAVRSFMN